MKIKLTEEQTDFIKQFFSCNHIAIDLEAECLDCVYFQSKSFIQYAKDSGTCIFEIKDNSEVQKLIQNNSILVLGSEIEIPNNDDNYNDNDNEVSIPNEMYEFLYGKIENKGLYVIIRDFADKDYIRLLKEYKRTHINLLEYIKQNKK